MTAPRRTCASPTCRVRLPFEARAIRAAALLRSLGWRFERQDGDDRPRWYCPRCRT